MCTLQMLTGKRLGLLSHAKVLALVAHQEWASTSDTHCQYNVLVIKHALGIIVPYNITTCRAGVSTFKSLLLSV